jgi:hypothetical protein
MELRIYVCIVVLWSSQVFSQTTLSSMPIDSPAFSTIKGLDIILDASTKEIKNMPKVQSQDTVGDCFGCASSTIMQKFICDNDRDFVEKNPDNPTDAPKIKIPCNEAPPEKMVSQLSMVAWADKNEVVLDENNCKNATDKDACITQVRNDLSKCNDPKNKELCIKQLKEELAKKFDARDAKYHKNIKIFKDATTLSLGANALYSSSTSLKFMPESCFPFDQLVSEYGSHGNKKTGVIFETIYEKSRELYESEHKKALEGNTTPCEECLSQLNKGFHTDAFTAETLSSAILKNSYGEFLFELLFKNCKPMTLKMRPPVFNKLPAGQDQLLPKSEVLDKIKPLLDKNLPVLLEPVCLKFESNKCVSSHTLVVSGYRTVCSEAPKDKTDKKEISEKCKPQLRIHNCWGEDWQAANNGGWVDAGNLIKNINGASTDISSGNISWLE